MTSKLTDAVTLRGSAYADPASLEARRAVFRYQRPLIDIPKAVVGAFDEVHDGVIVDVGCGSGANTGPLRERHGRRVIAVDLSAGMVATVGAPGAVADAARLPFRTDSTSGALAAHMLYHVPDPGAAVEELSRVCHPGAPIVLTGNGPDDKQELHRLWQESSRTILGVEHPLFGEALRTDGITALAREHLSDARCREYEAWTEVPNTTVLSAYLESTRATSSLSGKDFDAVHAEAMTRAMREIQISGAFRLRNSVGIVTARAR